MTGLVGMAAVAGARALAGKAVANAQRDWAAIPPKVKLAIVAIAASAALFFVHQHYAHKALKAADAAGYARAKQEDAAAAAKAHSDAIATRTAAEANHAAISATIKGQHDAEVRDNASSAGDLRLRGPGKAAVNCGPVDHPGLPAAAGGRPLATAGSGVSPTPVHPDDGLSGVSVAAGGPVRNPAAQQSAAAAVPWGWLVDLAQEHDDALAENVAWRSWYQQQAAAWVKLKSGAKP